MSNGPPRRWVGGIELQLQDPARRPVAGQVFDRAAAALREVAARTPEAYAVLRRDVSQILFASVDPGYRYLPFQMAIVIPPHIALGPDTRRYAAWLIGALSAAGYQQAPEALAALEESWPPAEREAIREWVRTMESRSPLASGQGAPPTTTDGGPG